MARPLKPDSEKATSRFDIRLTDLAKTKIKAKAKEAGQNMTDFFVKMALNGEVVVNDNSIGFFEFSRLCLVERFQEVGRWLNKSFTHRANMMGDIPQELVWCLRSVNEVLDYTIFTLDVYDKYVQAARAEDVKQERERVYAPAIDQKLGYQIHGLNNNLSQLNAIANLRDIHPRELSVCMRKVNQLLKRIS